MKVVAVVTDRVQGTFKITREVHIARAFCNNIDIGISLDNYVTIDIIWLSEIATLRKYQKNASVRFGQICK